MWDSPHLSHPTLPLSSLLLRLCGKHGPIPSFRIPTDEQGLEHGRSTGRLLILQDRTNPTFFLPRMPFCPFLSCLSKCFVIFKILYIIMIYLALPPSNPGFLKSWCVPLCWQRLVEQRILAGFRLLAQRKCLMHI